MNSSSPSDDFKVSSEEDIKIGKRMRLARIEFGYTQAEIARYFGISSQQIQKFEFGENRISAKLLYRMALLCNKPITWFVQDLDCANIPKEALHFKSNFIMRVNRYLQRIEDHNTQKRVLHVIRLLVENN